MKYIPYATLVAGFLLSGCGKKEPVATIAPSEFLAHAPTGNFSKASVDGLEKLKQRATTPIEKGVADLLIVAQYPIPDSGYSEAQYRTKLQEIIAEHPGTWIAVQAKMGLVESYNSATHTKERQSLLTGMLGDPGLQQLTNTSDPYLAELMKGGDGADIAKAPRDFVLSRLVYEYASGYDLDQAKNTAAQITEVKWKQFADSQVARLANMPPDVVAKRREAFIKGQTP